MNPRYGITRVLAYALDSNHWQLSRLDFVANVSRPIVLIDSMFEIDSIIIELFVVMGRVGFDGDNVW
jgi:hypothetical protein